MKTQRALWLIGLLLGTSVSCLIGRVWTVDYTVTVVARKLTPQAEKAIATRTGRDNAIIASDTDVELSVKLVAGEIALTIQNEGDSSIFFDPKDSEYVDVAGERHRLDVIGPSGASGATPAKIRKGEEEQYSMWPESWKDEYTRADSPIDGETIAERRRERAVSRGSEYVGRCVTLIIPMKVEGERCLYSFEFEVSSIDLRRIWWA